MVTDGFLPSVSLGCPPGHFLCSLREQCETEQNTNLLRMVLTRKCAAVAEAASAGRWGEGLQGDTVLLLRAARLDGSQVAVAA